MYSCMSLTIKYEERVLLSKVELSCNVIFELAYTKIEISRKYILLHEHGNIYHIHYSVLHIYTLFFNTKITYLTPSLCTPL